MAKIKLWWVKWWARSAYGYWHLVGHPAREGSTTLCGETIPGSYQRRIEWGGQLERKPDPKGRECSECRSKARELGADPSTS